MPDMANSSQQQADFDWSDEEQRQEEIAAQIETDAPVKSYPQTAGTDAQEETQQDVDEVEEAPKVTLRPAGDDIEYPLTLSVVGAPEGGFVFDGPDATVEVSPQVAEQVTYVGDVEVAE